MHREPSRGGREKKVTQKDDRVGKRRTMAGQILLGGI